MFSDSSGLRLGAGLLIQVAVAASSQDTLGGPPLQHQLSPTEHQHVPAALAHELEQQNRSPREQEETRWQQIISTRGELTSETGTGVAAWAARLRTSRGGALPPRASATAGAQAQVLFSLSLTDSSELSRQRQNVARLLTLPRYRNSRNRDHGGS